VTHPCEHLLIDGYNVLHAWPDRKTIWRDGIDVARSRLGDALRILHDREHIRVTLVFDGKGSEIDIERPTGDLNFSFLYTPKGITADTILEQFVTTSNNPRGVWIVSRDNGIRETVHAAGGTCIDPEDLHAWVYGSKEQQKRDLTRRQQEARKQWGQKLFPK
jgi:predicted RNA-binding protein with PIN domain